MTLRELIIKVTNINPNQTVLDLTDPKLDFNLKINPDYDEELDFDIAIRPFDKIILLEAIV